MYRLYDWRCGTCGYEHEELLGVTDGHQPGRHARIDCARCDRATMHLRLISRPAMFLYDRPLSPKVYGGDFDTMGVRELPSLPEIPDDIGGGEVRDFFSQPAYKEIRAERKAREAENKRKRQRARALKSGKIDSLRHHPLPGDPNWKD